eukprot:g23434.t1
MIRCWTSWSPRRRGLAWCSCLSLTGNWRCCVAPGRTPWPTRWRRRRAGSVKPKAFCPTRWQEKYEELSPVSTARVEDVRQRPSEEFFSLWESFLSDLKRAWEGYQRAQEAKTPRRSKSLPPRRRSAPILSAPHGVQGSKTPCSSPRFAGGNCDVRYVRYPRRRTAIGSASWADPPEGLAGLTGLAEKEPA